MIIVANIVPRNSKGAPNHFHPDMTADSSPSCIDVGPERSNHWRSIHRKARRREGKDRTAKRQVSIVVDVDILAVCSIGHSIKTESKRNTKSTKGAIVVVTNRESPAIVEGAVSMRVEAAGELSTAVTLKDDRQS